MLALVVALAAGLGGCTSQPQQSPSSTINPTGWRTVARDQVHDGGTLRLALDAFPATFQIGSTASGSQDDLTVSTLYLPSFVTLTADGTWQTDPDYAASVALVSTSPQVVEVKINPHAVWSDGTPITVADVIANWTSLRGTDPAYQILSSAVWQDVQSVRQGADDRDVLITFAQVDADWPSVLTTLYPAWAVDTPAHFNSAWLAGPFAQDGHTFVSGGPFIVTSVDSAAQVLTFGRNPAWWGAVPKLDKVIFSVVSRDSRAQSFANRELDAVDLAGSADAYRTAQGRSDAAIERARGAQFRTLTLNALTPALSDVNVRHALAMSLDRTVLARAVLAGVQSPLTTQDSLIYLSGQKGYTDHVSAALGGGATGAKKLLNQAGWDTSGTYATKNGATLTLRFVIPTDTPLSATVAELVRQQAAAAGFDVQIVTVTSDDFFAKHINTTDRDFDITYFAWAGAAWPISSTQSLYYPADSAQNLPGVTDPSLGALWQRANATLDDNARITVANQIDAVICGLYSTIPLFPEPAAWGVSAALANYGPAQFESVRWADVGFTG